MSRPTAAQALRTAVARLPVPKVTHRPSVAPDELSPAQVALAKQFALDLAAAMGQGNDLRGLLLAEVAKHLRHAGQNFTARLLQWAADTYEGKA